MNHDSVSHGDRLKAGRMRIDGFDAARVLDCHGNLAIWQVDVCQFQVQVSLILVVFYWRMNLERVTDGVFARREPGGVVASDLVKLGQGRYGTDYALVIVIGRGDK